MARVEERMLVDNGHDTLAIAEELANDFSVASEVLLLGLRMLTPELMEEFLAGLQDIKSKLSAVTDADELLHGVIGGLDPTILPFLSRLQSMHSTQISEKAHSKAAMLGPPEPPARKAPAQRPEAKGPELQNGAGAGAVADTKPRPPKGPPPAAAYAAALDTSADETPATSSHASPVADPMAEVRVRLMSVKPAALQRVTKLKEDLDLSDELELAIKMLPRVQLEEFLQGEKILRDKMSKTRDKEAFLSRVIYEMDKSIPVIISQLQALESETEPADVQQQQHLQHQAQQTWKKRKVDSRSAGTFG